MPPKTWRKGEKEVEKKWWEGLPTTQNIRGEEQCLPSEHPLMLQPRSEERSRHPQELSSELLPGAPQCWDRTPALGPARTRENIGNVGGGRGQECRCPRWDAAAPAAPGGKETLPYLWHKGSPESPCLSGLGACCRARWAAGRGFGRTRSRLLFILGQARASAKPPPLQPAHGSARLSPGRC